MAVSDAFLKPGPHLVLDGFLGPERNAALYQYVLANQQAFEPSKVNSKDKGERVDPSVRISSRLSPDPGHQSLFEDAVVARLDEITTSLGLNAFERTRIEVEFAQHGDGAFFATHIDSAVHEAGTSGQGDSVMRLISMVYYFCQTPAAFSGGEFRLHSIAGPDRGGAHVDYAPSNDRVVIFPSWVAHEVLPISVPSGDFKDSRFAVNCWVYGRPDAHGKGAAPHQS